MFFVYVLQTSSSFHFPKFFLYFEFNMETDVMCNAYICLQTWVLRVYTFVIAVCIHIYTLAVNGLFKSRNLIPNEKKMLSRVNQITQENFTIGDKCCYDLSVN